MYSNMQLSSVEVKKSYKRDQNSESPFIEYLVGGEYCFTGWNSYILITSHITTGRQGVLTTAAPPEASLLHEHPH